MPAFLDGKKWRYRRVVTLRDGTKARVSGTPAKNTKLAAELAERQAIEDALDGHVRIGRPLVAGEARSILLKLRVSPTEYERLLRHMERKKYASVTAMLRKELANLLEVDNG